MGCDAQTLRSCWLHHQEALWRLLATESVALPPPRWGMRDAGTGLFKAFRKRRLPVSCTRSLPELRRPSTHAYQWCPAGAVLRERHDLLSVHEVRQRNDRTRDEEERRIVRGGCVRPSLSAPPLPCGSRLRPFAGEPDPMKLYHDFSCWTLVLPFSSPPSSAMPSASGWDGFRRIEFGDAMRAPSGSVAEGEH